MRASFAGGTVRRGDPVTPVSIDPGAPRVKGWRGVPAPRYRAS